MKSLRALSLSVLLLASASASAAFNCNDACKRMVGEANVLASQGKYQEALARYKAAEQAEPTASVPLSSAAALMLHLSDRVKPEQRKGLRDGARALARRALALAPDDPVAPEVLRMLDADAPAPLRAPNAAASALLGGAQAHFSRRDLAAALLKYEAAMQADPAYSGAWIGAGDCYFLQQDYARAEPLFRRATEIEPRNSQAWRFLADAQMRLGKLREMEDSLLSAIAADPAQRPNWNRLADVRAAAGMPLTPLALRRGVRVLQGSDGKYTVEVDEADRKGGTPDAAIRLALAIGEVNARTQDTSKAKSNYEIELGAWRMALKVADEVKAGGAPGMSDPALLRMQAFEKDGQLEPAILLLLYRESFRPALEAWIAANPGGVKAFVDRHGVRP